MADIKHNSDGKTILAGTLDGGGMYLSIDGGTTWSTINHQKIILTIIGKHQV